MTKARAGRNTVTPAVRGSKRKAIATPSVATPVAIDSGDEVSEMGSQAKRIKIESGIQTEFMDQYETKDIGNRTVLPGKPVRGSFFKDSGKLDLFETLGMSAFITELPKFCYPNLVKLFYGNLHVNDKGQFVSFVKGVKITLNSVMLSSMLGVGIESLSVYSKRGPVIVDDFSAIDQLKVVSGDMDVSEFALPTTSKVLPMAHLLFRICLANICPRLGTKSNFSCQDLIVVAMLMDGRKFDLSDLVLNNMLEVVTGSASTGLPYGLLLTRIFEFVGVDFTDEEQLVAKDFLDVKGFAQSGLSLTKDGMLVWNEIAPTSPVAKSTAPLTTQGVSEEEQRAFMTEVRAYLGKLEQESVQFRQDLDKIVAVLATKKLPDSQLEKITAAVQKILEDADLSDAETDAAKTEVAVSKKTELAKDGTP